MSSETKANEALSVSFEIAVDFLKQKNASLICPVCNTNANWFVTAGNESPPPAKYPSLTTADMSGSVYIGPAFPMVLVTCGNCGYTRMHSAQVIVDSLSRGEEKSVNQEGAGEQQ